MDFKQLNKIQTPDDWISDILTGEKPVKKTVSGLKLTVTISIYIIMAALTVTAAIAAVSGFCNWLFNQFGKNVQIIEISGYEVTDEGFFKKDGDLFFFDGESLAKMEVKSVSGTKICGSRKYDFNFDYVIKNGKIHAVNKSENILSITSFDDRYGIIWLNMGNLWNSYFVDLKTGNLTPVADENGYDITEGILKLATDVRVSDNKKYLLYRSNRDTSKTDGNKGEWFIQDLDTSIETKLERAPIELFYNEIGFIEGSDVAISYDNQGKPLIFDCDTKEYTELDSIQASDFGSSLIYYEGIQNGNYVFKDVYKNKTYKLPSQDTKSIFIATRKLICIISPKGDAVIYLTDTDKTLTFKSEHFADNTKIYDVRIIDENTYLFVTSDKSYIVYE